MSLYRFVLDLDGRTFFCQPINETCPIRGKKDNRERYDLTLEHLTKIIETGDWVDMKK